MKAVIRIVETENFVLFSLKNNLKSKTMIQFYPKYKQFKAWVDAKDYENAVRSGLDYLRYCEVSKKLILEFVEEIE